METSTPVQLYNHQHPIIDEDASMSPVTLSGQDTRGGTPDDKYTNQSRVKISGDVMVLEITPPKSE